MGLFVWLGWCGLDGVVVPIWVRKARAGAVGTGDENSGTGQLGCSDGVLAWNFIFFSLLMGMLHITTFILERRQFCEDSIRFWSFVCLQSLHAMSLR